MGGDRAPEEPVRGALFAVGEGHRVILVGDEPVLRAEIARQGGEAGAVEIRHAPDRIESGDEGARAVRGRPDSSLVVATKLVADGEAGAVVSMGNTGAMMTAATLILRRVPGVHRPAIAVILPTEVGTLVLLDAGANADARPEHLPQFATMGRLFARDILGVREPRIGLLSIGEEPGKGSELIQEAHALLKDTPGFVGNVEGRDIPAGTVDVVVTDGFTGNVALKLYEASGKMMMNELRRAAASSKRATLGGWLLRPALRGVRKRIDPEDHGGAYLLGVQGIAIVGHGSSSGRAVANAIRLAGDGIRHGTVASIAAEVAASGVRDS